MEIEIIQAQCPGNCALTCRLNFEKKHKAFLEIHTADKIDIENGRSEIQSHYLLRAKQALFNLS